jgi:hypothetical protein
MPDDVYPPGERGLSTATPLCDDLRRGSRGAPSAAPEAQRDVPRGVARRDDRSLPCAVPRVAVPLKTLGYCRRCGEEIELADDLDSDCDIDRHRHVIFVAGQPRQLTPTFWQLFVLLYRRRGTVVSSTLLRRQRENLRLLRKLLAGSRYQIVNHRDIGYELIVTFRPAAPESLPVPHMISAALERAPEGLSRAAIADAILRDYGSKIFGHTLTRALLRMRAAGRIRRVGYTWFLI